MRVDGLVLWDIDKTLVDVSGVSREIYAVAFERVVGRPLGELANMTGRTEHAILVDTLALSGVSETKFDAFYEALGWAAHDLQGRMREVGRALPGARSAIAAVRRQGVVQVVATGNLRSIAETKLHAFHLAGEVDLDVGGYGSDGGDRSELVRLARERTNAKYGAALSPGRVVVIGDTTLDIEAAVLRVRVRWASPRGARQRASWRPPVRTPCSATSRQRGMWCSPSMGTLPARTRRQQLRRRSVAGTRGRCCCRRAASGPR